MEIKHTFTSPKGDGPDSTLVRPSSWNNAHTMAVASPNKYIGRDKSGAGPAQELGVLPIAGADDGTLWTAAKVQEYVTAAIAAIGAAALPLGTIVGSVNGAMPGFLPLNGQTFGNVGSSSFYESTVYQALFQAIWVFPQIVVEGGKGATANADWLALKSMVLPQSAGCVMGAQGGGFGMVDFFSILGADAQTIAEANLPAHKHTIAGGAIQRSVNGGGGTTGVGNAMQDAASSATETDNTGGGVALPIIQRTMILQVFWIKH